MQFFMRFTTSVIILLTFFISKGQTLIKELKIQEVGWTLFIPNDANILNAAQFDTIQKRAFNAINKTYGVSPEEFNKVKPLFTIRQGQFNFFGSTINPYDSSMFDNWQQSYLASKGLIMNLFRQQGPDLEVTDTASSKETIDGLTFEKFYIKTFYPQQNITLISYWFYRKHGKYDFSINISYTDESIGRKFLDIIKSSKFEK